MFTDKNGRPISVEQIMGNIQQQVMQKIETIKIEKAQEIAKQHGLDSVLCPEHQLSPQNIRLEPVTVGSEQHQIVYDECCPELVVAVKKHAEKIKESN